MSSHITSQFSTSEPFFKIGDEIFQVDLSGMIVGSIFKELTDLKERRHEIFNIREACEEHIREKQAAGVPLVVDSEPILIEYNGWFKYEYYLKVHLKDEPRVSFYIMNPIPREYEEWYWDLNSGVKRARDVRQPALTFKSHGRYMEYICDCEACASMGY